MTTESLSSTDASATAGAGIGFGALVSFIKLQGREQVGNKELVEEERTFTLGSLLARLRSSLLDNDCLIVANDEESWKSLVVSDIVELQGRFHENPLIASANRVRKALMLTEQMSEISSMDLSGLSQGKTRATAPTTAKQKQSTAKADSRSQFDPLYKYLDSIIANNEDDASMLYVVESTILKEHRAVVTLFPSLTRAKTGVELPNGEFRLLGKVARIAQEGDAIDLLQGTALAGLGDDLVTTLVKPFESIGTMLKLPKIVTAIQPPAVIVVPIAVYA